MLARALLCFFICVAAPFCSRAQINPAAPGSAQIPFDEWLAQGERAQIPWKPSITNAELSEHQRLRVTAVIELDGKEVAKRRGEGEMLMLARFIDSQGRSYQTYSTVDLEKAPAEASAQNFIYAQHAFVVPGEYTVWLALFDTATREYSLARRKLRVHPLDHDPLPESWRDLPAVEFVPAEEASARWFLPSMKGRLRLPLETRRPVRVHVLFNLTEGTLRAYDRWMAALIPSLKAISDVTVRNGTFEFALLDLSRNRVGFEQKIVNGLEWAKLEGALQQASPNAIDVQSLQKREQSRQFFSSEVRRRVEEGGGATAETAAPLNVVVVISAADQLPESKEQLPSTLAANPDCRVFYIRYLFPAAGPLNARLVGSRGRGGMNRRFPIDLPYPPAQQGPDSIGGVLKPLKPRLFDVWSPIMFRKALAGILAEISRL